jgi:hypothetical protein
MIAKQKHETPSSPGDSDNFSQEEEEDSKCSLFISRM